MDGCVKTTESADALRAVVPRGSALPPAFTKKKGAPGLSTIPASTQRWNEIGAIM
jgi:hypothetical protein